MAKKQDAKDFSKKNLSVISIRSSFKKIGWSFLVKQFVWKV